MIRTYSGMPSDEFIADLREAAIKGGMKTSFIDQIDNLSAVDGLEIEIEALGVTVSKLEDTRDGLIEELECLLEAMRDLDPDKDAKRWKLIMESAEACIARESK